MSNTVVNYRQQVQTTSTGTGTDHKYTQRLQVASTGVKYRCQVQVSSTYVKYRCQVHMSTTGVKYSGKNWFDASKINV